MKFDFEKCRSLFLDATLAELAANEATILKIPGYEVGGGPFRRSVSAISLEIGPGDRSFDLALRDDEEKWDDRICNSIGDWKLYPLRRMDDTSSNIHRTAIAALFEQYYGGLADPQLAREIAHLMFLAAAEALLDHAVTTALRHLQIDAPFVDDTFLDGRCFEYIVTDSDNSIAANYCEIVIANRITQRLKLQLEQTSN